MKIRLLYILLATLTLSACGSKKLASGKVDDGTLEPDQIKPQLDTRFQEKFFAAQLHKSKGEVEKAYALFSECAEIEPNEPSVHFELARIEVFDHLDPQAALPHINKSIEISANNEWYHRLRAEVYMSLGKYDLAAKEFAKVYQLNPADENALYDQATALLYINKYEDAIKVYDELEKNVGVYEELSFRKHELYMQQNKVDQAGQELVKLAEAFPTEARYWGIVAQFYQSVDEKAKSKQALDKMVSIDPDNGLVHYQLSEYYAAEGDDERSYEEIKAAFKTTDLSIDEKIMVMMKFYQLTEANAAYLPKAYELLDILTSVNKNEAKAFSIKGDFLYRDARDNEAVDAFLQALKLDETKSAIWEQTLNILYSTNRTEELIEKGTRAVELYPNNPLFYLYLGAGYEKQKNYDEAIFNWNIGKELVFDNGPLMGQFFSSLGAAYNAKKDYPKSDEAYDKAIKLLPFDLYLLNNYAYYLSLRKAKLDKAAEMSKKTVDAEPNNSSFLDTYGWILYQQEKYDQALIWIRKAIDNDRNPGGEVLEHLGDTLFKLGRKDEAIEQWKAAQQKGGASPAIDQKVSTKTLE
ncbi:MAG: tetratricopeptide repeat protein [Flavobacteriales bacterium]